MRARTRVRESMRQAVERRPRPQRPRPLPWGERDESERTRSVNRDFRNQERKAKSSPKLSQAPSLSAWIGKERSVDACEMGELRVPCIRVTI